MGITVSIGLYLVVQIAIGIWVSRKVASQEDYFLAGRKLGPVMASFSIFATWFGAETCIGASGAIFSGGLSQSRAEPFGYFLCLVLMSFFLAGQLYRQNIVTLADLYRQRFSPTVERFAAIVLLPTSLIWAAAQIRAFGQIISVILPVSAQVCIVGAALFIIIYTFMGGLMGDVISDIIQGVIIMVGLFILLAVAVFKLGGIGPALESITPDRLSLIRENESWLQRLDSWMVPILGSLVTQELVSRVMASRCAGTARNASLGGALMYLAVGSAPVLLGLVGHSLIGTPIEGDQFLPTLAKSILPQAGFVVFVGALMAAILSTVDSALLSSSALLSRNVFAKWADKGTEKNKLMLSRGFIVLSGLIAMVLALSSNGIHSLIIAASTFGTSGILIITLFALFAPNFGTPLGAGVTLIVGVLATHLGEGLGLQAPFVFAVAACLVTFIKVSWIERFLKKRREAGRSSLGFYEPAGVPKLETLQPKKFRV